MEVVTDFIFLGSKSLWIVTVAMKLKDTYSLEANYDRKLVNLVTIGPQPCLTQ